LWRNSVQAAKRITSTIKEGGEKWPTARSIHVTRERRAVRWLPPDGVGDRAAF
jgi:hypothetical protein